VFESLNTKAGELNPVQDLLPSIQFMERRNQEVIQSIQAKQESGRCEQRMLISDDTDHLHLVLSA